MNISGLTVILIFFITMGLYAVSYKYINRLIFDQKYGPHRVISNGYKHKISRKIYNRFLFFKWECELETSSNYYNEGIEELKKSASEYNIQDEKNRMQAEAQWKEV